jgi:2-hydroxy-3-keto-5-methylthiopentenyl-1-phosphate phosphatase
MLAFLDYDGTLTTRECNEIALQKYTGDAWRSIEQELKADRLSHADGFDRQIGLVRAPRAELLGTLVGAAVLLPGLRDFLEELERRGGRAVVVSAGLREAIEAVWRRDAMPPVELYASELVGEGPDAGPPYHVAFNPALGDCPRCGPRLCKGALLRELRRPGETVLVFGDGASDLCPAREADLTFARDHLAERCEAESLAWRPLPDFTGVWGEVDAWLRHR